MAFNAKNLSYDKNEPSFLRKLRGEYGGNDGRHNVQIARPKRDRLRTGDADEDEPVILDESGEIVQRSDLEERLEGKGGLSKEGGGEKIAADEGQKGGLSGEPNEISKDEIDGAKQKDKQQVAEIGVGKKRKVGKIVGGEEDNAAVPSAMSKRPSTNSQLSTVSRKDESSQGPSTNRTKKKGKKIKLSFDEPEDG